LKYNTNVTHLPEELMSCWMHFKRVRVNASVDAVGPLNEYIRYPSKWPKVLQNLKVLDNLATKNPHIHVSIHTTVQMYNVLYLTDILEYFSSTFKSIRPLPFANILDHPEYLNI